MRFIVWVQGVCNFVCFSPIMPDCLGNVTLIMVAMTLDIG